MALRRIKPATPPARVSLNLATAILSLFPVRIAIAIRTSELRAPNLRRLRPRFGVLRHTSSIGHSRVNA
jgi:hypothetical protein